MQRDLTANAIDNPISGSSISPDGRQLAYADQANGLLLLQIDSGEKRQFPSAPITLVSGWYPDGTHLLLGGPGADGLWKMSTVDGTSRKLLDGPGGFFAASVSPDGSRIAFVKMASPNEIWVARSDGEDVRRVLSQESSGKTAIFSFAWAPTSQRILYVPLTIPAPDQKEKVSIESCDLNGDQRTTILDDYSLRSSDDASPVLWRPSGRVYFRLQEPPPNATYSNIWSIDVDSATGRTKGNPSRVTNMAGWEQTELSQSADGKRVVLHKIQEKFTIQIADLQTAKTGPALPRALGGDDWDRWDFGWTNDGHSLVFVSDPQGRRGIFEQNLQTHQTRTLVSGPDRYGSPAVTPDGQWLLFTRISKGNGSDGSTQLMRMPLNGGAASLVLAGRFDYACASKADVCVLSEINNNQEVFSVLDPVKGRGPVLAHANPDPVQAIWDISPDGRKIAFLPATGNNQRGAIQILNVNGQGSSTTNFDGWYLQTVHWSPDNQHLYVSGYVGQSFKIALVGLGGSIKVLLEMSMAQGWPSHPRPSPDGRYLAYEYRTYGGNLVLLENF